MQWVIFLIIVVLNNQFSHTDYSRDWANCMGGTIAVTGLTVNGGFPEYYRQTGRGDALVLTGLFAWVAWYCASDEVKCIKAHRKGLTLK